MHSPHDITTSADLHEKTHCVVDDIARLAADHTPHEVAQRLHFPVATVEYALATGRLPAAHPQWSVDLSDGRPLESARESDA